MELHRRAHLAGSLAAGTKPKGTSNLPIAPVVQEISGVHEHIRDVCRRWLRGRSFVTTVVT